MVDAIVAGWCVQARAEETRHGVRWLLAVAVTTILVAASWRATMAAQSGTASRNAPGVTIIGRPELSAMALLQHMQRKFRRAGTVHLIFDLVETGPHSLRYVTRGHAD